MSILTWDHSIIRRTTTSASKRRGRRGIMTPAARGVEVIGEGLDASFRRRRVVFRDALAEYSPGTMSILTHSTCRPREANSILPGAEAKDGWGLPAPRTTSKRAGGRWRASGRFGARRGRTAFRTYIGDGWSFATSAGSSHYARSRRRRTGPPAARDQCFFAAKRTFGSPSRLPEPHSQVLPSRPLA